ncbi:hypothetical protein [Gimesia maris]|uniref:hypothetical protein n=1 Tax=Gimesia maris TaxID=122 RepID=UPI00241DC7C1|nr:hypothetical protein [Gimesia maris]|tara:strand:- start:131462 stop:132214 length:753 start_codon:yes stop_codon:yes gene_type:complete
MSVDSKHREELNSAYRLIEYLGEVSYRDLLIPDDVPDVLFPKGNVTIGIEVTKVIVNQPKQSMKAMEEHELILREVVCRCRQNKNIPPQAIRARFNPKYLNRNFRSHNIRVVYDFVRFNYSTSVIPKRYEDLEGNEDGINLPVELEEISLAAVDDWSSAGLLKASGGFIHDLSAPEVLETLKNKESKLPEYLKKCDKCWLLIETIPHHVIGLIEWSERMDNHNFISEFDRVFFYDKSRNSIHELRLSHNH